MMKYDGITLIVDGIYYHSYRDLHLIMTNLSIPSAVLRKKEVIVPGRSGKLDLSKFLGEAYDNRMLKFEFHWRGEYTKALPLQSYLENLLTGKKIELIIDDDNQYKWQGVASISNFKQLGRYMTSFDLSVDTYPYKKHIVTGKEVL